MKKTILSLLLALLPLLASADNNDLYADNLDYSYNTLTKILTVYGNGPMRDYSYDNSPWYGFRGEIQTIIIKEGITSIGKNAFHNFIRLTSVNIPNSLISIGDYAFDNCNALTSIVIPQSVTSIGRDAFNGTSWYNNLPDGLIYAGKVAYKYKGEMPENTHIEIQEGTIKIADDAFKGSSVLANISIPNSVESIGENAFYDCNALTSITIPNSVTS